MKHERKEGGERVRETHPIKKRYEPPSLTVHGDVEEITKALGGGGADGQGGSRGLDIE